jgi:hypothetical protein
MAASIKSATEINDMYYNLSQSQLQKFKCQVQTDTFEKIKDSIYPQLSTNDKREIDSLQFYLTYEDGNIKCESNKYPSLDNVQVDIGKIINGTDLMVTGTFTSWKGVISEPIIGDTDNCSVIENENGYVATYKQEGNNVEIIFNKDYMYERMNFSNEKIHMTMVPDYVITNEGILVTKLSMNIGNGLIHEDIQISYQKIKGIPLPDKINVTVNMATGEQKFIITCFNYDVETK